MNVAELNAETIATASEMARSRRVTICYPFAGDSVGGSHFSVLGLLENLDPAQYRVLLVPEIQNGRIAAHFSGFEQLDDPGRADGFFTPGEQFSMAKYLRTFAGVSQRVRFLREQGADIVHTNDGRTHASWALAARLAGAQLVWHHRADPDALGLRLLAPLLASKVLTVSSFSLPKGRIWSAARKAKVVFSPFDTSISADRAQMRQRILELAGLPDDALLLGIFGSFVPRKRPLLFVDLIAELRSRLQHPVYGLMFGEAKVPEMDRMLRAHIDQKGMGDRVKLMGFRTPGHEWIAGCDQLIVPAVGEPLGRTLVEAMLVRTPVVATRSGGNGEALADGCGVLVDPESATSLADGVETVLADPGGTAAMLERAELSARERFGKERHAASVMQVYDELLCR
ncbi:MAG: glycosyltransferase family 4 protein [Pseudomonadota bacterium]